jgi:hypothetical protein
MAKRRKQHTEPWPKEGNSIQSHGQKQETAYRNVNTERRRMIDKKSDSAAFFCFIVFPFFCRLCFSPRVYRDLSGADQDP